MTSNMLILWLSKDKLVMRMPRRIKRNGTLGKLNIYRHWYLMIVWHTPHPGWLAGWLSSLAELSFEGSLYAHSLSLSFSLFLTCFFSCLKRGNEGNTFSCPLQLSVAPSHRVLCWDRAEALAGESAERRRTRISFSCAGCVKHWAFVAHSVWAASSVKAQLRTSADVQNQETLQLFSRTTIPRCVFVGELASGAPHWQFTVN